MMRRICMSRSGVFATMLGFVAFIGSAAAFGSDGTLPGWGSDFIAATNTAVSAKRPLVLLWANVDCRHCAALEAELEESAEFASWQEESGYEFCYVLGIGGHDPDGTDTIKTFAGRAAGTAAKNPVNYPYICLYWPKDGGAVSVKSFTTDYAETLMREADGFFAGYEAVPDYFGGVFSFTAEYDNARFEAEAGFTAYVDVPLSRTGAASRFAGTNTLSVAFGETETQRETVLWEAGDVDSLVRVQIPAGAAAGDEISVSLLDEGGAVRGAVRIFVVERENSTKNPLFIGERTKDTLQYGEWTMDLDVAMEKYRAEPDSKLVVAAVGSLWCPDCVMTDSRLVDTDAFRQWAVDNKVILVDLDIPNVPNIDGTACLLTRSLVRVSDGYVSGRGTLETNETERYQSGTGYLSRHQVSDEQAAEVLARNMSLVCQNTLNGGWNNPDRANQYRTGIPNFFTLNRDGVLAGTLETFDILGPKTGDRTDAYLARFTELVGLGGADGSDVLNRSWQTTQDAFSGAEVISASLSALDYVDTYALAAAGDSADMQTVTVSGDSPVEVTASILFVSASGVRTIATAKGPLSGGVSVSGVIGSAGGDYYVSVSIPRDDPETVSGAESSVTAYTLAGTRVPAENPFSNEWTQKASASTIPLYAQDGSLAGTLALNFRKNGAIGAKYSAGGKVVASFSGRWDAEIAADGTATATLSKRNFALSLEIAADGSVSAAVSDGETALESGVCGLADSYADFAGVYTVAFPSAYSDGSLAPSGNAFMSLKMARGAATAKNGRFRYTVHLPDGKTLSGTTGVTWADANFGIIPVRKTSGGDTFSAVLKIRRDAGNAPSTRAIVAGDGGNAVWNGTSRAGAFTRVFDILGSWYARSDSLLAGIEDRALTLSFVPVYADAAFSPVWGGITAVAGDGAAVTVTDSRMVAEKTAGFKFRFKRSTGEFSGTTRLSFEGRPRVPAKFSGVLTRGWFSDCDCGEDADDLIEMENVAFGLGYCLFTDRIEGKSAVRSFRVEVR